jgi:hypothetical protein
MPHSELLFIDRDGYGATQRAVVSSTSLDGTYQLTIRAKAIANAHTKQAYAVTYAGPDAELFYSLHHARLTKGQPLRAHWHQQHAINGTILAHASVISLEPTAEQARQAAAVAA